MATRNKPPMTAKLARPVYTRDGKTLRTRGDAADYMTEVTVTLYSFPNRIASGAWRFANPPDAGSRCGSAIPRCGITLG